MIIVLSVCRYISPYQLRMAEPIFMKLGMYIMAPEPISVAYFMNPISPCVCPPIIAKQQLSKDVTAAMNTHTTEELLDAFSMRYASYQGK
jgi:hypothetical protein